MNQYFQHPPSPKISEHASGCRLFSRLSTLIVVGRQFSQGLRVKKYYRSVFRDFEKFKKKKKKKHYTAVKPSSLSADKRGSLLLTITDVFDRTRDVWQGGEK